MNGFITRTLAGLALAGGLAAGSGCCHCDELIDPCWPERYNFAARREVCAAIAPQVRNGHILDQTIYNYYFEDGTDELNEMGQDKLLVLIRRRPCPDPVIFLATAQDISYDPEHPEKFAETRCELDNKRILAIQKYLVAQTAGRHFNFRVVVHDPAEGGWDAVSVDTAIQRLHGNFQGVMPVVTTTGAGGGALIGGGR